MQPIIKWNKNVTQSGKEANHVKVKIAVFGSEAVIKQFQSYTGGQENIEIFPLVYSDPSETETLVEKAFMCDIYLFSGALSYQYAKEKIIKKRLPAVQVEVDAYMILMAFYYVKNYKQQPLERLSIDVPDASKVDETLDETGIACDSIYTYSYGKRDAAVDIATIVKFHEMHWKTGKVDHVLTSISEVEQLLHAKHIPVTCMRIPNLNIKHALEKATSLAAINQTNSVQIIIGYVHLKHKSAIQLEKGNAYGQELHSRLHQILHRYAEETNASIFSDENDRFVLFGTRDMLDHITSHYRDFPLMKEIEHALDTPVDIGFGLGLNAKQAESNAQLALETCGSSNKGACYVINERGEAIGPLGVEKQFNPSILYRSLIHKAKLNNELSYNFIDFIEVRNNEPFSSNDIANYYQVTKRSAERTIKKLLAGDVIKVVGEEKPYVKGRPRKLFQLNQTS
ncbi:hypothetical protein FH966_03555 [Lentibacillus cibarius]|uniref:Transcriptional regulator n=1 Tax=Lentibacillus cibarius TaxID=2583219 RepID=A0A549YG88_9BACI|nr:hypothetical protein FH966_03555 [Lentibacillus cibarius]